MNAHCEQVVNVKHQKNTSPNCSSDMHIGNEPKRAIRKSGGRKRGWKKPRDKPKRPLSAYNLFFQYEREKILNEAPDPGAAKPRRSHGKIGFAPLARSIAAKWSKIDSDTRTHFENLAAKDKERYTSEMKIWNEKMKNSTDMDLDFSSFTGGDGEFTFPSIPITPELPPQKKRAVVVSLSISPPSHAVFSDLPHSNAGDWIYPTDKVPLVSEHSENSKSDDSITTAAENDCETFGHGTTCADEYDFSGVAETMNEALRVIESSSIALRRFDDSDSGNDDEMAPAQQLQHHHQRQQQQQQKQKHHHQPQPPLSSLFHESFYSRRSPSPDCTPFPLQHPGRRPSIAELASKLDNESMDLLSGLLRR